MTHSREPLLAGPLAGLLLAACGGQHVPFSAESDAGADAVVDASLDALGDADQADEVDGDEVDGDADVEAGCRDLSIDPVAHYAFDSCSATTSELRGTGLDATLVGASCDESDSLSRALGTAWSSGTSLSCNGGGAYADAPDSPVFEPSELTFAAWILSDGSRCAGECAIVSKGNTDGAANGYWLRLRSSGSMVLTLAGQGFETDVFAAAPSPSTWHHVAFTFDGSTAAIYVDGELEASGSVRHDVEYGPEHFLVGAMTNRSFFFAGSIDDVMLWDVAMTGREVADLYASYFCT